MYNEQVFKCLQKSGAFLVHTIGRLSVSPVLGRAERCFSWVIYIQQSGAFLVRTFGRLSVSPVWGGAERCFSLVSA